MTEKDKSATNQYKELSKAQADFLALCGEIGYGKIQEVIVQKGEPVYASTVKQDYKFG